MGLLDALSQYWKDASPGGVLNPEITMDDAKGLLGMAPVIGDAISLHDAVKALQDGNYGEAALSAVGVSPFVPNMGIFGPLYKDGLKNAELSIRAIQAGERPITKPIGYMTPEQFDGINHLRVIKGYPAFKKNEILYNAKHHVPSREGKDGANLQEMLAQIESSLSEKSIPVAHKKAPALENPQYRKDQFGDLVRDRAVLEGGGDRPTWLLSAYGRKKE